MTGDDRYKEMFKKKKEVHSMCDVAERLEKMGIAKGIELGREEGKAEGRAEGIKEGREEGHEAGIREGREEEREAGIRRLIEDNLEEKKTKEIIIQKLIRWFSMDAQTAQLYLDKYAGSVV